MLPGLMKRVATALALLTVALPGVRAQAPAPRAPLVLAAASLQEALSAIADRWARAGHARPVLSFAASSALARQLMAGAPADLFISADSEWMDTLAARGLIVAGTRADIAGNALVLVAPAGRRVAIDLRNRALLARALAAGPLAMADPDSVPAGRYGRAALTALGVWPQAAPHVVRAENVRAALALVERGAAPFGIVYATDAQAAPGVRIVARFPAASHPPITYPIARLRSATADEAEAFRRYVLSPAGRAILRRHGFLPPPPAP